MYMCLHIALYNPSLTLVIFSGKGNNWYCSKFYKIYNPPVASLNDIFH